MTLDPRFGDPIGPQQISGMAVALKVLVLRAGGEVRITERELLSAENVLMRVDANSEEMRIQVVEGVAPDTPRMAVEPA